MLPLLAAFLSQTQLELSPTAESSVILTGTETSALSTTCIT